MLCIRREKHTQACARSQVAAQARVSALSLETSGMRVNGLSLVRPDQEELPAQIEVRILAARRGEKMAFGERTAGEGGVENKEREKERGWVERARRGVTRSDGEE